MKTTNKKQTGGKLTLEKIQAEYHKNDVCMIELLATLPAQGLTMEESFELNIAARKWADGDKFFRVIGNGQPHKLRGKLQSLDRIRHILRSQL